MEKHMGWCALSHDERSCQNMVQYCHGGSNAAATQREHWLCCVAWTATALVVAGPHDRAAAHLVLSARAANCSSPELAESTRPSPLVSWLHRLVETLRSTVVVQQLTSRMSPGRSSGPGNTLLQIRSDQMKRCQGGVATSHDQHQQDHPACLRVLTAMPEPGHSP